MLKQNIENKIVQWIEHPKLEMPVENSPDIYEQQRVKAYTLGYNQAKKDLQIKAPLLAQSIVEEMRKEIPQLYQIEFTDNRFMEGYDKGWKDYKNKLLTSLEVKEDK